MLRSGGTMSCGSVGRGQMASMKETAERFFEACETGKGWAGCEQYCYEGATFSAQSGALESVDTLEKYTDWMKGLLTPLPDGNYEVRFFAVDNERNSVAAVRRLPRHAHRRRWAGATNGKA